jgi:hypothetical protein
LQRRQLSTLKIEKSKGTREQRNKRAHSSLISHFQRSQLAFQRSVNRETRVKNVERLTKSKKLVAGKRSFLLRTHLKNKQFKTDSSQQNDRKNLALERLVRSLQRTMQRSNTGQYGAKRLTQRTTSTLGLTLSSETKT